MYLRIRPGHRQAVQDKLVSTGIDFIEIESGCLSLSNATKIEDIIELDKEAVVQDLSSQQIGEILQLPIANSPLPICVWDCCAGSGGKSLLLYDLLPDLNLTVSDIRQSILANLKKRFARAGVRKYHWFVADLTDINSRFTIDHSPFDLIICDAPCTGSGTWSRTPEQLYFFDEKKIDQYALVQTRIVTNVIPQLRPGSFFVYITCSVFKRENEDIVHFIEQQFHVQMIKMKLLRGYQNRADSMFVSVFRNGL
ncbi:MAG: methyltransferase domain-containing protein [Bacteroidetes bacterium]|nr:MAG: methyltransferase domain-containing protein [Bacteroidota bacterium]